MGSMKYLAEELAQVEDLAAYREALVREQAIREVMAESGESREIVVEMIDSLDAMAEDAVLELTEGQPTTLRDALSRYVDDLEPRHGDYAMTHTVAGDLSALLNYPWPAPPTGLAIDREDNLERKEGEPEGYHVRETVTLESYPLMGSSPAERAESLARGEAIRRRAMRDHAFVGDGPYCSAMIPQGISGSPETGVVTMTAGCGYPRETHPDAG